MKVAKSGWGDMLPTGKAEDNISPESVQEEKRPTNPPLYYSDLDQFVGEYLVFVYRRETERPDVYWCRQWWKHEEAIARLEAIWRSWELLRLFPAEGASRWWLNHADPNMRVLLSEDGPFHRCRDGEHNATLLPLPVEPAPDGMFKTT